MKKHFAVALVLAIIINTLGDCSSFIIGRAIIHAEISSIIANTKNSTKHLKLFITFREFRSESFKLKNSKEFVFKGQFYDISAADTVAGGIIFTVIRDDEETMLVNKFVKDVSKNILNFLQSLTNNSNLMYILEKYYKLDSHLIHYFSNDHKIFISLNAFYAPPHAPPEFIF